jgi:hypothetical protein
MAFNRLVEGLDHIGQRSSKHETNSPCQHRTNMSSSRTLGMTRMNFTASSMMEEYAV